MSVLRDPAGSEIQALREAADLDGRRVLEVGCGDGRLTWRYAELASHVTAIDPDSQGIRRAEEACPPALRRKVEFRAHNLQDFHTSRPAQDFDLVLLSWSL